MTLKVTPTSLPGVLVVEPRVFHDERGFFLETFSAKAYAAAGIDATFVQDNVSRSVRGTIRGLHFQEPEAQGKLCTVLAGSVYDVAVDVRQGSPTFGKWTAVELDGESLRQIWIPPGFAHGFCVLSERVHVEYKCTGFYDPADEVSIAWNDPRIGIRWPIGAPTLSAKDQAAPLLAAIVERLGQEEKNKPRTE